MKLALSSIALAVAGVCSPVMAAQLQGQVTDLQGAPIAGALVSIDGGTSTSTNPQGQYQLTVADNSHIHLHISDAEFKHVDRDLQINTGAMTQDISLTKTAMENIVVTASPLARSALESTTPISVLTEDQLKLNIEPTLGDTLENYPAFKPPTLVRGQVAPSFAAWAVLECKYLKMACLLVMHRRYRPITR